MLELIFYTLWIGILLIISIFDIKHRIIPDSLIILGIILGIIFTIVSPNNGIQEALFGLVTGIGVLSIIAILTYIITGHQGMGGGDIKFLGMIGVFIGWRLTLLTLLLSLYMGGILSLLLLLFRLKKWGDYIPYGPFLAVGATISLLWGTDIIKWYGLLI